MGGDRGRRSLWLGLVVATAAISVFAWTGRGGYGPLDVGSRAPHYAAISLGGDTVRLDDLRGEVVLVNVWATWCPPCVREMPSLQRLHDALAADGLRILAVNVDKPGFGADPRALAEAFVAEYGLTFEILLDPEYRIESIFQLAGLPMTFVIDRRGTIRRKVLGAREWDGPGAVSEIRALLEN